MKAERLITPLLAGVLSFLISLSAVACLVTGFDMAVGLGTVALWCGVAAVLGSVFCTLPLSFVPFTAAGMIGVILWITGALETSVQALLYRISRTYNSVYGWGILKLNHYTADDMETMLWLSLCFLGAVLALLLTWSLCRRKTAIPGVFLAICCLFACLVVTATVPDTAWLYCLLLGIALVLLTHTVRRENAAAGNKLTLITALPLTVALLVLFIAIPQDGYTGEETARTVTNAILNNELVQQVFGDLSQTGNSGSSVAGSTVRLDTVGIRTDSDAEIMQVHTENSGILYLRGRALDSYDGTSWTDSGTATPRLYWPAADALSSFGEVTVQTRYAHRMLYLPYYVRSTDLTDITRGMENEKKLTKYSFSTGAMPGDSTLAAVDSTAQEDYSQYLHLTEDVLDWAVPLTEKITAGKQSVYEKAQAIAVYVRSSAKYSLKTDTMPARERDFVKWFLEDSSTGYCVHFASSATVLLQAAGIPARYVTGYMTPVGKDCYTTVREQDAHAWAEYWLPGFGWTVLEATPAAEAEQEEEITVTLPEKEPVKINWRAVGHIAAGVLLAMIPVAFIQRYARLCLRRKKLRNGDARKQLLAHWREAALFARCLGQTPDERLLTLAEKAKFSPHIPCEQDFAPFKQYLSAARQQMKRHNLLRKLYYRFVLALY